jgi:hypothetical protein
VIDGTEVNRLLAYWRAGGYRPDPEGADGYAPGAEADVQTTMLKQLEKSASSTAVQTGPETFIPGDTFTITNTFSYSGSLLSLMWRPQLPKGWEITEAYGDGSPEVRGGEILWTGELPPSPVIMEYTVRVPEEETMTGQIYAEVEYQSAGESNSSILFLNAGMVLKHPYDDTPPLDINGMYESNDGSVRVIVQTYTTGSAMVLFIGGLTDVLFFLDDTWRDGIDVSGDLAESGYGLSMRFPDDSEAWVSVIGADGDTRTLRLEKVYSGPDDARDDDGIYRPFSGNSPNLFVQSYTEGSTILVFTDDLLEWLVFLDEDWTNGIFSDRDLTDLGYEISLDVTARGARRMLLNTPEGVNRDFGVRRVFASTSNPVYMASEPTH